ncbi:MAG TPA: zf-TFIIB domain-containing protein [Candidatus Polarisedimenticolaceae bacterium]|nr:zf-TFIIB domain-containing protein [Candidatus Polarisedimenticolaceae bacterium]
MHRLVACPNCHRQYDAAALAVGAKFRCRCGQQVTVPEVHAVDAAVVRCASCGAAREGGALSCRYCGSDFTIHDQDLETVCPSCLARISDHAKFCHHCGTPIAPEEIAADPTDRVCPACGSGHLLRSRSLGESGFSALECTRCGGLWLGEDAFEALETRERASAAPEADAKTIRDEIAARPKVVPQTGGPFYRPCPVCKTAMTRINFSKISGILLDSCRHHGIWFDATELEAALHWIKIGGERAAERRDADEAKAKASQDRFRVVPKIPDDPRTMTISDVEHGPGFELLPWLISTIFK